MDVTHNRDFPMLFEEISPQGPLALARLRRLRSDLCCLFVAGGVVSAVVRLVLMG
jgi:hypothetical protein